MTTPQFQKKAKQAKKETPERKAKTPAKAGMQPAALSRDLQAALADPQSARPEIILQLQRLVGNRAVTGLLQRKVTVGPAHDRYEQEADRVAQEVVNGQGANEGKYNPDIGTGKQLLGHELTHTIQQTEGLVQNITQSQNAQVTDPIVQRVLTPATSNPPMSLADQAEEAKLQFVRLTKRATTEEDKACAQEVGAIMNYLVETKKKAYTGDKKYIDTIGNSDWAELGRKINELTPGAPGFWLALVTNYRRIWESAKKQQAQPKVTMYTPPQRVTYLDRFNQLDVKGLMSICSAHADQFPKLSEALLKKYSEEKKQGMILKKEVWEGLGEMFKIAHDLIGEIKPTDPEDAIVSTSNRFSQVVRFFKKWASNYDALRIEAYHDRQENRMIGGDLFTQWMGGKKDIYSNVRRAVEILKYADCFLKGKEYQPHPAYTISQGSILKSSGN